MKAHTPGPWVATKSDEDNRMDINGDGFYIAEVIGGMTAFEANISLIAAAPELLEALRALMTNKHLDLGDLVYTVREREGEGWEGHSVKAWSDAVTAARAAIAKATGETP